MAVFTPDGGPQASWRPTITNVVTNANGSLTLTGTQLNGLNEGAAYGDDEQMAENYPIVQVNDFTGGVDTLAPTVYFATTSNWSSTGVATGNTPQTVNVVLPAAVTSGDVYFSIVVIANGIASQPFYILHVVVPQSGLENVVATGVAAERTSPPQTADVPTTVPMPIGNVVSLANPVNVGTIPPSPASTTGLGSTFVTADNPSAGSALSSMTADSMNWLNDTESQWAGLYAALDVLNA